MKRLFFVSVLALLALSPGTQAETKRSEEKLAPDRTPVSSRSIYQLEVHLSDDGGKPFPLAQLLGRPVVLTLFYSQCAGACPLLVDDMRRIEAALPPAVSARTAFLLLSFDDDHDDSAALRRYRETQKLGPEWTLLRGSREDVRTLAMVLGVNYKQDGAAFVHSNVLSILNRSGEISYQRRGFQEKINDSVRAIVANAR